MGAPWQGSCALRAAPGDPNAKASIGNGSARHSTMKGAGWVGYPRAVRQLPGRLFPAHLTFPAIYKQ